MKEMTKIINFGLIGAGAAFLLIKYLPQLKAKQTQSQTKQQPKKFYLTIPPITIPKIIDENSVQDIVTKLESPKYTFTTQPVGWKLSWPDIPINTPVGSINLSIPSQQLPLIPDIQMAMTLAKLKTDTGVEDIGNYWRVKFPPLRFNMQ